MKKEPANSKFDELLIAIDACHDARVWARDKTFEECWKTCTRPDWMLFLAESMVGNDGWPQMIDVWVTSLNLARYVEDFGGARAVQCVRDSATWIIEGGGSAMAKVEKSRELAQNQRDAHEKIIGELVGRAIRDPGSVLKDYRAIVAIEKAKVYALETAMQCSISPQSTARFARRTLSQSSSAQEAGIVTCQIVRQSLVVPFAVSALERPLSRFQKQDREIAKFRDQREAT